MYNMVGFELEDLGNGNYRLSVRGQEPIIITALGIIELVHLANTDLALDIGHQAWAEVDKRNEQEEKGIMSFGEYIHKLRMQKNLSQRNLANQIDVDFTYLSKIEGGHFGPPSEEVIRKIAKALEADENELINLAGKVPRNLKAMLEENPQAAELVRILSERRLPDEIYGKILLLIQESHQLETI